ERSSASGVLSADARCTNTIHRNNARPLAPVNGGIAQDVARLARARGREDLALHARHLATDVGAARRDSAVLAADRDRLAGLVNALAHRSPPSMYSAHGTPQHRRTWPRGRLAELGKFGF